MQKNFHSKLLVIKTVGIFLLTFAAFGEEAVNPNFFWTPSGFVENSSGWNESKFEEMWEKYPVYLKLDTYKLVSLGGHPSYGVVRDEIERIEYYEKSFDGEVEAKILEELRGRLPKNSEKLADVGERFLEMKNAHEADFEQVAQLFHLALCYYTPAGEKLDVIEEIFGPGVEDGSGNIVYFFGTSDGGFQFKFFMEDEIVNHISFSFEQ